LSCLLRERYGYSDLQFAVMQIYKIYIQAGPRLQAGGSHLIVLIEAAGDSIQRFMDEITVYIFIVLGKPILYHKFCMSPSIYVRANLHA